MVTVLLIILLILLIGSLFYRPYGTGYLSYSPSLLFLFLLVIVILYIAGVL